MQLASPGSLLMTTWRTLRPWPGGRWAFSRILGLLAPYTGSITPFVEELRPGYARVSIRERRALRNHLESVHAIALANLAEVASGLATLAGLPPRLRGIVTGLSVSYVKKARGHLTAECNSAVPELTEPADHEADVVVRDERGDVVVQARARWRLSPTGAARDGRAGVRARRGTMRSV